MNTKWFDLGWWQYLFSPQFKGSKPTWRMILCRMGGHKAGVWWYSSGLEPDMHCKNCGEDIG